VSDEIVYFVADIFPISSVHSFGDTVNTAARMESNGAREKIHISEQTVSFLAADGKEDWYIPREDKILAKGIEIGQL